LDFVSIGLWLWELFKLWLYTIFAAPFLNLSMLWVLIPVWLGWFFAEFFQEKIGTSMGNAISNATIVLWGAIDCTRQTTRLMSNGTISSFWDVFARFSLIGFIFLYGIVIITLGLKGKKIIKSIGRVREVTYFFAIFVPVLYGFMSLSWIHILASIIFFPLFYFAIELIDRFTPNPKAIVEDMQDAGGGSGESSSLSNDISKSGDLGSLDSSSGDLDKDLKDFKL
jgi:ABC-type multidrug transport system fused ATPase/permease subunit